MLEPGTLVAGYRVERVLGSGGMGAVFLARHPELPRYDALKVLKASAGLTDSNFRRRFLREAEVAATLDHPNIVTVFNRGRASVPTASGGGEADMLWIAMQYVPGTDCARELAAQGPLAPHRVAHIVSGVARGIDHANRRGLLHRDIKPANILLAEVDDESSDEEQRVLLTDFGVAKISDETEALTSVGTVLATLSYASPEQLMGRRLDGRTDQYSLAASTFHLLTGRVPFDDRDNGAVIGAHLKEPVPRASGLVPGLPPGVDEVIAQAMAKSPEERFANCRAFADALATSLRRVRPRSAVDPGAESTFDPGTESTFGPDAETVRGLTPPTGGRRQPSRAQPPGAEPFRAEPSRAEPLRADPHAPTHRATPRPAASRAAPPLPAPPESAPSKSAPSRPAPSKSAPPRPARPRPAGPAHDVTQQATPKRPSSRPATGADPMVWQHPPPNTRRQTNDHLRAAGQVSPERAAGGARPPGPGVPGADRFGFPPAGPNPAGRGGRPAGGSNRLPVVLAIVAVALLILIGIVFAVAL
ncbi:protein kinase [Gordonia jinghuaiqii]|uniref:non-specific serine/threonine protein kinase n=1 Tax=Gordonia jinghuaiqii TaxID=2758710 RepID=A0A7D7RMW7_9ACTN|nr:serine/threonine-protein kinase [Gordonia jinghuaiqii]MCR5977278.1 protein kinase [Gordonia jinghuaiqii]QMT00133.1 serine/threonine protein kinase [Gordonia jinghuaiqii]